MAVCDQQLGLLEARRIADPPELVAAALQVGLTRGRLERIAFVEEEDRLELCPGRAEEPQPPLLRAAVRAFVRQHDAVLVGLGSKRGDEAGAVTGDAVGTDVVLREEPVGRLLVACEHSAPAPVHDRSAGLFLGVRQGQVDDVVRAAGEELRALLGRDHVVRRSHELLERAGALLVVTLRPERLDHGHLGRP